MKWIDSFHCVIVILIPERKISKLHKRVTINTQAIWFGVIKRANSDGGIQQQHAVIIQKNNIQVVYVLCRLSLNTYNGVELDVPRNAIGCLLQFV